MSSKGKRISLDGGQDLSGNPFAALGSAGLPTGPAIGVGSNEPTAAPKQRSRGRVDVRREKSGRGGKTVTVASGFKGISEDEKHALAKKIQKRCGVGGAVKAGNVEIQGDKRQETKAVLEEAGFRVVFTGG